MSETIVKVHNLCVQSGKQFLLRDINWEVKRGEHWLVFGMNGSGKTTLLSTVAGFRCPTRGQLEVFGQPYQNDTIFSVRRKIGWVSSSFFDQYLWQEPALQIVLSGLSGTLGIRYSLADCDVRKAKALLRELHLGDKIHTPFHLMSKGERQNVLIARALITEPEILVLDEPSAGLDLYARQHMMHIVRDLAECGQVTTIYVTHYPEEIQPFMHKALLLRKGQVFSQGEMAAMMTSARISELMSERVLVQQSGKGQIQMQIEAPTSIRKICYTGKGMQQHV